MAEGGGNTTFENPAYDPFDNLFDDDDDMGDETTPFIPETSTRYSHEGETIEMQTMRHETSGLPQKSYVETGFGAPKTSDAAWDAAKDLFPNASPSELEVSYDPKGKLQVKKFGVGKKLYKLFTTDRSTGRESINKSLPKEIREALGSSKYEKLQQITRDKRKELKESQEKALQKEKNKKDMDEIREELRKEQSNLESLENSDAPQRDIEKSKAKIRALEAEHVKARKNYDKSVEAEKNEQSIQEDLGVLEDLQEEDLVAEERDGPREALAAIQRRKERLGLRKEEELRTLVYEKSPEKIQRAKDKLFELDKSYQQIVADENTFKAVLGEKLTLTEEKKEQLRKDKEILKKKNEEDKEIADDRDKWPGERRRAQERIDFRNKEIRQIDTQLEEGGESLTEKVKEIFKKYGLTLAGIFAAAGVVIGTIVGVITKALKDMGKKIADGLKTLGQKAASALPGLIGSIVSFLFKTAGQVLGFLAEHTWLLILAVVVFLVEKVMKKQR